MGKSKNLNRKPDEILLGENRLLKKQVRSLQRELRESQKQLAYKQNNSTKETKRPVKIYDLCTNCGKGSLSTLDIGIRKIVSCNVCEYQKVTK